jgi:hypothetical protein
MKRILPEKFTIRLAFRELKLVLMIDLINVYLW